MALLVAGNWKMNGSAALVAEAGALARSLAPGGPEVVFAPPATLLGALAQALAGTEAQACGQDCHMAPSGAHTGDLSAPMLAEAGARYVILGHSERRADHGESDAIVAAKARAAHAAGLVAIICVGETARTRDEGRAEAHVCAQLAASLPEGATASNTLLAYEPVWAIGTGRTPAPADVAQMHAALRAACPPSAAGLRILYGGSVNPANAASFFALPGVDGALVGGAALDMTSFAAIIAAAAAARAAIA